MNSKRIEIKQDDLSGGKVIKLLQQHHDDMLLYSPVESVHALNLSALGAKDITFWSAWIDGELAGCGALKEINGAHGEVKSMRTNKAFLRRGVAQEILTVILNEATKRTYNKVSLETGTNDVFLPAQKLYQSFGFEFCEPFSNYVEDPYSTFMTLKIGVKIASK